MKKIFPIIVFLLPFIVFLTTLNHQVTYTDNGELAGAAITLGIPHSTGYPFFIILSHLWSYLPISDNPIYELNIFSALFTALSSLMLFNWSLLVFKKLKFNRLKEIDLYFLSLSTALSFVFGSVIWEQANYFEVYPLHLFLINTIIYFIFKGDFENNRNYILLAALFIGLSFANHLTTILLIPFLIYLHFIKEDGLFIKKENFTNTILPSLLVLIGISLYIYLPIRSSQEAIFNWGNVSRGWDKFIYHVSGKQYQVWMFQGKEEFYEGLSKFLASIKGQSWLSTAVFPFVLGLYFIFKRNRRIAISLLLLFFTCLLYSSNYGIHDIEIYFSLSYIVISFAVITLFAEILNRKFTSLSSLTLFIPLVTIIMNYQINDNSNHTLVDDYTEILCENIEQDGIIISAQWDIWNAPFWYKQQIESYRNDIILIEKELMRRTWYPGQLLNWYPKLEAIKPEIDLYLQELEKFESDKAYNGQLIQARYERLFQAVIEKFINDRPVYVTIDVLNELPRVFESYTKVPQGFAFKLLNTKDSKKILPIKPISLGTDRLKKSKIDLQNHLDKSLIQNAAVNLVNLGRYAMLTGQVDSARVSFEKALELDSTNSNALMGINALQSQN